MADPDKLYQDALNQISDVQLPDPQQMQLHLQRLVQEGNLTPEKAQAILQGTNAYSGISTNPAYTQAQQSALGQLQEIGEAGGITPIERAQIADVNQQINTAAKGREQALAQQARERGIGGSGLELAQQESAGQAATDRAAQMGLDISAQAQQRALQAIQGAGQMGSQLRGQQFGEQAMGAQAQNAIDTMNNATLNRMNLINTQAQNAAQAQNLSEKQRISDVNANAQHAEAARSASIPELQYQAGLQKAGAQGNVYQNWAGQAEKEKMANTGYNQGLLAGGLQAGGRLIGAGMGGPVGSAVGGAIGGMAGEEIVGHKPPSYAPQNENQLPGFSGGGVVGYTKGGILPGAAKLPGDNPMNDTRLIKAAPGEAVLPRSTTSNLFGAFLHHLNTNVANPSTNVDPVHIAKTLKALSIIKQGAI